MKGRQAEPGGARPAAALMWFFSGIPVHLQDMVFTEGYSIENDLYIDSNIERILDSEERKNHSVMIAEVCRWFAYEVDKYKKGLDYRSDPVLSRLVPVTGYTCCPNYLRDLGFCEPPADLLAEIARNYGLALRGRLLYEIIVRFTHAPKRGSRKYSYAALKELSSVYGAKGRLVTRIIDDIRLKLGIGGSEGQFVLNV